MLCNGSMDTDDAYSISSKQHSTNRLFSFEILLKEFLKRTSEGIHRVLMITKEWLSAIGARESKDFHRNEMTFHLPLHRYLSILTSIALNYQNGQLKDLFPNNCEHFLLNLARFPLRIQQVKYEIHSNRIWISNQYEMQMQMTMYSDTRANLYSYMNDADIYLLQVKINNHFQMIIEEFCLVNIESCE